MAIPTRDEALSLLNEYVTNVNLQRHMFAVEAAMREYARYFSEDDDWWGIVGLLHDFDYERYPDPVDHPYRGATILRERGYDEDFIATIVAHASHTGTPRDTLAKKAIFAVDELTGLIVAVALVKPNKTLAEVDVPSVKKKMKNTGFARQVNRQEIIQGAAELGIPLDEHLQRTIHAMQTISQQLAL